MQMTAETLTFATEAKQILELMTHSVYSHKEVFLRELISNASDALDKLRFEAIEDKDLLPEEDLHIFLMADEDKKTLSICDNGIGMTLDEVKANIGTIARSGTKEFIKAMQSRNDDSLASSDLIGQFGVGFYSSFMVANRVEMITRRAGANSTVRWESSGDGSYTIEELSGDDVPGGGRPGTMVTLHLAHTEEDDSDEETPVEHNYTADWELKRIVKKYSDFVSYPIKMDVERTEIERDDEGKPVEGGEEKKIVETETLNSMKAIWTRPKNEVTDEEYQEFYRHVSHDWHEPLKTIAIKAEGTFEFKSVLFIPSQAPMDMFHPDFKLGLKLYVRRVFIMDDCKDFLPEYLRFVRGVVDAEDLNLNVSRELLQQDRHVKQIQKRLTKKVLDALKEIKNKDIAKYKEFWAQFGAVIKEGIYRDPQNRDAIMELVLCDTTYAPTAADHASADDADAKSDEAKTDDAKDLGPHRTTLAEYVERMRDDQEEIFYLTGPSRDAAAGSPHLEAFIDKGYEVLLFSDPVDEIWLAQGSDYDDKSFKSAGKGEVELGSESEREQAKKDLEEQAKAHESLLEKIRNTLGDDLKEVRLSPRLKESAACLVGETNDMTPQMEHLMRSMGQEVPKVKRILEINPGHPVLAKLQSVFDKDDNDPVIGDYAHLLHGQAVLAEGGALPDPGAFSKLVANLMARSL